jgi:hypothetical protein
LSFGDRICPAVVPWRVPGLFLLLSALGHLIVLVGWSVYAPVSPAWPPLAQSRGFTLHWPGGSGGRDHAPDRLAMARAARTIASAAVSASRRARHAVFADASRRGNASAAVPDIGTTAIRSAAQAVVREQAEVEATTRSRFLPPPERAPKKSRLQQSLEHHARPDCRQAYSSLGLLAIVPLVADTATDRGCRW